MRRKRLRSLVILAGLSSAGLGLALGLGAPLPGIAERAYIAAIGLLSLITAASVSGVRLFESPGGPPGRWQHPRGRGDGPTRDPALARRDDLESSLLLGSVTSGDFHALVRPRLQTLAGARLRRHGISPGSPAAADLLGPAAVLVDPRASWPDDRNSPGTPLSEIEELARRLEALG